jgi:hypothetical protein
MDGRRRVSVAVRTVIAALIAVLIAVAIVLLLDHGKYCPEDQVSVLSTDRWVCVKEGGKT